MTAFKNTIAGRILRGVAKVALPVVGIGAAVLTGGAASGIIAGGSAIGGIRKTAGKLKKLGQGAVNLVTGTTKNERDQVNAVKAEAKKAQDKLDQVERLVAAGASRNQANQMAGITAAELGSADAGEKDAEAQAKFKDEAIAAGASYAAAGACAANGGPESAFYLLLGVITLYFAVKIVRLCYAKR